MKTGFLSSLQFWGAQYFRMYEALWEGDKITLFGTVTYDINTNQASVDDVVAMMTSPYTETIKKKINDMLNSDYTKDLLSTVFYSILALAMTAGIGYCAS